MKAVVYTQYGSPDVLHIKDVEKPTLGENEILVKQVATTVTPTDCAFLKASPFIIRFMNGLTRPKNTVLGGAVSGIVEAVGSRVTSFKPGDAVMGMTTTGMGTHTEFKCMPETGH